MDDGRAAPVDSPAVSTNGKWRQIGTLRAHHSRRRTRRAARLVAKNFFSDRGSVRSRAENEARSSQLDRVQAKEKNHENATSVSTWVEFSGSDVFNGVGRQRCFILAVG